MSEEEIDLMAFAGDDPETKKILRQMEEKNRKPLNTMSMIEKAFFKNLKDPRIAKMARDLESGQVVAARKQGMSKYASVQDPSADPDVSGEVGENRDPSAYEKSIVKICDLKDFLIRHFSDISQNEKLATVLTKCIKKAEEVLTDLGFEIEDRERFIPIQHCSGLKVEDKLKNAKAVAENTKTNYSLYHVAATDVVEHQGKPCVSVKIEGEESGKKFCVVGSVMPDVDFSGNEAIDYVRRHGEGMFSVKAYKLGRWENVSGAFRIFAKEEKI